MQLLRIIYRRYRNLTFKIENVVAQDNKIAAVWQNSGTDMKGNPYQNQGVAIFRIEKGQVIHVSDYFKNTSFANKSQTQIS